MDDSFIGEPDRTADKRKRAGSSSVSELDTNKEYGGSEGDSSIKTSSLSRKNRRKKKKKELELKKLQTELNLIPEKSDEGAQETSDNKTRVKQ